MASHSSKETSPQVAPDVEGHASSPTHIIQGSHDSEVNDAMASGCHSNLEHWYAEYRAEDGDDISLESNPKQ